ncbi:DUF421 domain-containing protein [Paeniglutamicibacter antarcticus]|uniref:DUF421 domain-containing protein n=1 Tax=Arthrobacter terrae TaxID=2935737 RepID=A0A931CR55_9MICC|nr:YetF domain-containing protein [Arthrobacter terrae]MBG0741030.1 DUF421 domain-containing protein [Arthrobacter terrae]
MDSWSQLGLVAGKAALMFVVAAFGLRIGERRTVAQWTIIDFVTAVAIGAVVGRTAVAASQSFITGAVALLTLIAVHRLVSLLRFHPRLRTLFDHRVRVLVHDGVLQRGQLRRCGLADEDVFAKLREHGVFDLAELQYLLYESKGALTIVRRDETGSVPLIRMALDGSAGSRADRQK